MIKIFTETNHTFEGQRPDETVHIFIYRHWITLVSKLLWLTLFIFLPVIPLFLLSGYIAKYHIETLALFVLITYYILIWSSAFYTITMYLLDNWIVTNERVLDITQHGFFSRTISEMSLTKVQDISVKIEGFVPTLFGYGSVEIQTAGATEKFIFKQVPNPNKIKDEIMECVKIANSKSKL